MSDDLPHLVQFLLTASPHVQAVLQGQINLLLQLLHLLTLC